MIVTLTPTTAEVTDKNSPKTFYYHDYKHAQAKLSQLRVVIWPNDDVFLYAFVESNHHDTKGSGPHLFLRFTESDEVVEAIKHRVTGFEWHHTFKGELSNATQNGRTNFKGAYRRTEKHPEWTIRFF